MINFSLEVLNPLVLLCGCLLYTYLNIAGFCDIWPQVSRNLEFSPQGGGQG